jgi:hypothetical protein
MCRTLPKIGRSGLTLSGWIAELYLRRDSTAVQSMFLKNASI